MKIITLFAGILTTTSFCVFAEESPIPHITVYGTATTEVVPDQMQWSLQVKTVKSTPEEASTEEAKAANEVLGLLKELKIDDKSIQMSQLQLGENREYSSSSWVKRGYYAKTDVVFKLRDFSQYQKVWSDLAKIPGLSVESTSYEDSKRIAHRNETRKMALEAAKEKANEMATVLGSEIREPLEIEEDLLTSQWYGNNTALNSNSTRDSENQNIREDGQLAVGTIPIQARVKVSFHIVSNHK